MNHDLFTFDESEFAAAQVANSAEEESQRLAVASAAITRRTSNLLLRKAKSQAELSRLLPAILAPNTSYHIVSSGDIDALSYLQHINAAMPLDTLLLSTWCMALPDAHWLFSSQDAGRIGHIALYFGEILPNSYPDVYEYVSAMKHSGRCQITIARNHAKIILAHNELANAYYVIESSANVNTNPRIEQTAIHTSEQLHNFYYTFFMQIHCIDTTRKTPK